MTYIALGSQNQNRSFTSKHSTKTNGMYVCKHSLKTICPNITWSGKFARKVSRFVIKIKVRCIKGFRHLYLAVPQLKRKIKIGGSVYLVSSHGKSLKRTVPSKDSVGHFSTAGSRANSLHVYRRPSTGSSPNTVNKIFKRQNSVDKNKTRKAKYDFF